MTTFWWIGGGSGNNWSAVTPTNWSSAGSGGARTAGTTAGIDFPNNADSVILDGNSGAGTSNINVGISLTSFDASAFTGALTQGTITLTISGNDAGSVSGTTFALPSTGTYAAGASSQAFSFTATSGTTTVKTNGKTCGNVTVSGAGGTFSLSGSLTYRSDATLTITAGTLNTNGVAVTGGSITINSASTKAFNYTNSIIMLQSSTIPWNSSGATGTTTITKTGGSIVLNPSATPTQVISITAHTSCPFPAISFIGSTAKGLALSGATLPIDSVTISSGPSQLILSTASTYTIGSVTLTGSDATHAISLSGPSNSVNATLSVSGTLALTWTAIARVTFSGAGSFSTVNCIDCGGNSGLTINPPNPSPINNLNGGFQS